MIKFLSNLFGYLLGFIYGLVNNYGIAIIIFSILLKLVLLPITLKQQKAMKKNSEMQKLVLEIQDKYSNDQARQSQELADLYKREHYNPLSGCLTSIVQMLIVLAMFYLVSQPLTYMKHVDSELLDTYYEQISEDSDTTIRYREIAIIRELGSTDETVNLNMDFFGLNLTKIPSENYDDWTVFIIPVLYVFTSLISSKIVTPNSKKKEEEKKEDVKADENSKALVKNEKEENKEAEAMMEMNKNMQYMIPIMAVSIALIAPLGLALYWLVGNLFTICERLIINKFSKKEENENNG